MEIIILRKRWDSLLSPKRARDEFDKISQHYGKSNRFYHTLKHIEFCLNVFDVHSKQIQFPDVFEIALWLHDAIYEPTQSNNESLSAEYAENMLCEIDFPHHKIQQVKQLILCTQHPSTPVSNDEKYIIDIDLSILGSQKKEYEDYSDLIKKEYSHLSPEEYAIGRKKVLYTFIHSEFIFHTPDFYEQYERQARNNIEKELSKIV